MLVIHCHAPSRQRALSRVAATNLFYCFLAAQDLQYIVGISDFARSVNIVVSRFVNTVYKLCLSVDQFIPRYAAKTKSHKHPRQIKASSTGFE